jgi:dihydrofolate reductase
VRAVVTLIAAIARGGVIGDKGVMPWRMPSDLKHFRAETLGKPVVMGRKTFQSIGKALPGRRTIVVTRDPSFAWTDVLVAADVETALSAADEQALALGVDEIVIAGGGEIYRQTLEKADRLIVTELDLDKAGDARFPAIDPAIWREVRREPRARGAGDEAGFEIVRYERRPPGRS